MHPLPNIPKRANSATFSTNIYIYTYIYIENEAPRYVFFPCWGSPAGEENEASRFVFLPAGRKRSVPLCFPPLRENPSRGRKRFFFYIYNFLNIYLLFAGFAHHAPLLIIILIIRILRFQYLLIFIYKYIINIENKPLSLSHSHIFYKIIHTDSTSVICITYKYM